MSWQRIYALLRRNILITFTGFDPLIDFFYWPIFDIIVWGFSTRWLQHYTHSDTLSLTLLTSLVLWQGAYRGNFDITFSFVCELWFRNIVNLFSTPLTLTEWLMSTMLLGAINACLAFLVGSLAVWLLYGLSVFSFGWPLVPIFLLLIMSGWCIGLLSMLFLVYGGQKLQKLVWVTGWMFIPFSGVFYDPSVLPYWAQYISSCLPMSYLFRAVRVYIATHKLPLADIATGASLNVLYFIIGLTLFQYMFKLSKTKGLARLEND